jgi:hypothetical protein
MTNRVAFLSALMAAALTLASVARAEVPGTTSTESFNASLALPQGAKVTAISCVFRDTSATYDMSFGIVDLWSSNWLCGPFTTSGNPGDGVVFSGSCAYPITVNYAAATYVAKVALPGSCGSSCSIYHCWVDYTVTSPS